jgi:dihydrofolate reductase
MKLAATAGTLAECKSSGRACSRRSRMRDLIVTENITLDGVIDASEGWFSVADDAEVDQSDLVAALREQSEAADAVLFGRVTFEEMRGYWPKQTDDTTGVSDYLNRVTKYVVSSTWTTRSGSTPPCSRAATSRTNSRP